MGPLVGSGWTRGLAEGEVGGLHSGSGTWKLWIRKLGHPETRQSGNWGIGETRQSGNWGIGETRNPETGASGNPGSCVSGYQGSWVFMFFMWTCAR